MCMALAILPEAFAELLYVLLLFTAVRAFEGTGYRMNHSRSMSQV